MLARFSKAIFLTFPILGPLVISQSLSDPNWRWPAIAGFAIAAFLFNYFFVFKPDTRFYDVRRPTLDALLDGLFSHYVSDLPDDARSPFRVRVYRPRGVLKSGRFFRKRLVPIYTYEVLPGDGDYALSMPYCRGFSWNVFESGSKACFDKRSGNPGRYGSTVEEQKATEQIKMIIAFPLWSSLGSSDPFEESERTRSPDVVVNFDAITPDAAETLLAQWNSLQENRGQELIDVVKSIGLYF